MSGLSRRGLMWVLFAGALCLYLPGLWWGLPIDRSPGLPWGTDELGPVGAVNEMYGVLFANRPHFNPQYPLFQYMVQVAVVAPYYLALWLTGHISYPAPMFPYGLDHPGTELRVMTLLARSTSLVMASAIAPIAFATGETLRDRRTGVIAAIFVALPYPVIFYARTSNVDMGALFWTALGLFFFARALMRPLTTREWFALGTCAALATASKDPSYAAFLPAGAVAVVLALRRGQADGRSWSETLRLPLLVALSAALIYVVASGLVFRPSRYVMHVRFITRGSGTGVFYFRNPPTLEGYFGMMREFSQQVVDAMGAPMVICAVAGLILWAMRSRRLLLWVLPAAGVFAGVILPVRFVLLRFVLIIVYVIAFCAADIIARGTRMPGWRRTVAQLAFLLVVAVAGVRGADLTYQMLNDSRVVAAQWLQHVARPGDRVGYFGPQKHVPELPADVGTVSLWGDPGKFLSKPNPPEFLIALPLEDFEVTHEAQLPDTLYERLTAGQTPYREAALLQTRSLFSRRPASFVNPPIRIFIRGDLWDERLGSASARAGH